MERRSFIRRAVGALSAGLFSTSRRELSAQPLPAGTGKATGPSEGTAIPFRAILASYADPTNKVKSSKTDIAIWDKDRWNQLLTQWSREGYTAVVWWGPNELQTGNHVLLPFHEFPEARELAPEQNEKIIAQMKWLFRRAKELGMTNFLYPILIAYTKAFSKAHGLDKPMKTSPSVHMFHTVGYFGSGLAAGAQFNIGVRNEITRAYIGSVYAEMIKTYDDLDGFYGPMGEAVPGDKSTYFSEAVVPGLERSGRKPLYIVHQWQVVLDEWVKNILPVYDNKWLGYHAYNAEQITDAKPCPGLVQWAETTGLPTVAAVWASNAVRLPFNSPKFAYEMTREMKKTSNFHGFMYWENPGANELSPLFRKALARYGAKNETYSDEPWVAMIEEEFGDRDAARHFLNAFDVSGRILPEASALIWHPGSLELRLPYNQLTYSAAFWSTSRVRGPGLLPIWHYAYWAAKNPKRYKDRNGSEWQIPAGTNRDYVQQMIWGIEEDYDIIPPVHMAKVRAMGETCLKEAEQGLTSVKRNHEEARRTRDFMKAYQLLTRYYERKVAAAIAAHMFAHSHQAETKAEAEKLADEVVASYTEAATFLHEKLDPAITEIVGAPMTIATFNADSSAFKELGLMELIQAEKDERKRLAEIFKWPA